ncbi:MAG: hypothetical protein J6T70_19400 [Bacteroidales bacterium]|nr:hypothetical protein [Bacteroidales bacterium]
MLATRQLNPVQLNIIKLMSYIDTEQEQQELQDILLQFYRKKNRRNVAQFPKGKQHNSTDIGRMG